MRVFLREELKSRGVEFTTGIRDESWGLLTHFRMPGDMEVELYQSKYKKHANSRASGKQPVPRKKRVKRK